MKVLTKFYSGEDTTAENFNLPLVDADDNFGETDERIGTLSDIVVAAEETIGTFEERIEELEGWAHEPPPDDIYDAPVGRGLDGQDRWHVYLTYSSDDFEYSNGAFRLKSQGGGILPGTMIDYGGVIVPSGWLQRDGSAISRSTYSALFAVLCPSLGAITVSIASPCVVSLAAHGMRPGDKFFLTTTGALPTGLSPNAIYYVIAAGFGADSFRVSATRAGAAINTSGSQSGVHTLTRCPYGLGNGSTTYNLPDAMGRVTIGAGDGSGLTGRTAGETGGEEGHAITSAENGAHTHTVPYNGTFPIGTGSSYPAFCSGSTVGYSTASSGSGTAHNTMQPFEACMKLIKY